MTLIPVPVVEIIRALEREAGNTDTDPRWIAATALRRMQDSEQRTLVCDVDLFRPSVAAAALHTPSPKEPEATCRWPNCNCGTSPSAQAICEDKPPTPAPATGERDAKDEPPTERGAIREAAWLAATLDEAAERLRYSGDYFHDAGVQMRAEADWAASEGLLKAIAIVRGRHALLAVSFPIQQEWQPIATAPKDGTHFLACTATTFLGELWWEPTEPQYDSGWFDGQWHYKPKYWMPLLRLPIQQDADDIGQQEPGAELSKDKPE